jgi:hypothetical protein
VADEPGPAERGVRWSDVPLAAVYACEESEMAIARQRQTESCHEFEIRTVEGYPGLLRVSRDQKDIYRCEAVIGIYGDRTDRAETLISEFHTQMRAFGRKRQYSQE